MRLPKPGITLTGSGALPRFAFNREKKANREVTMAAEERDRFEIPKAMRFDGGSELRSGA